MELLGHLVFWGASLVAQMVKNLPAMQETRFDPWVGRFPWSRKCNPLQYSCLFNPMDRGTWQVSVHMVAKQSDLTEVTEP